MASSLRLGQFLRGHSGMYTIGKQLQGTVWFAKNESDRSVIVKSIHHFRLQNERDVLKRFHSHASISQKLTSPEIKYVAMGILELLRVLHKDESVHTDINPHNVLLNNGQRSTRFSDVQLADFGCTVPSDSAYAKNGDLIGAPIWRSPEAHLGIGWGTATDIWSFGALLITLLYGDNLFLFKPDVPADHDEYEMKILQRQCEFLGPFPLTYRELCPQETLNLLAYIMQNIPPGRKNPSPRTSEKEVSKEDKELILKVMKLDPRDRPSAAELLQDKWFDQS